MLFAKKILTANEMRRLDRWAIEEVGIPSLVLMENAGRAVYREVTGRLKNRRRASVCIFCGTGNNAGDGFVTGRYLMNAGIKTKVFLIGNPRDFKKDAAVNYRILGKLKYPTQSIERIDRTILRDISRADFILDAIFGVGLNRPIENPFKDVIEALNEKSRRIISLDIPSGLDATTGKIYGVCVKAWMTVTFSCAKKGFLKNKGPYYTGKVVVADIGISGRLLNRVRR